MLRKALFISFCMAAAWFQYAAAQATQPPTLRGYIKKMPAVQLDRDFGNPGFMNLLNNRLNFRWNATPSVHLVLEGRNRLLYNEIFNEFPAFKDILKQDPGLMDLSWVWLADGAWIGHSMVDRMYVDWRKENLQVRIGRQRINWGLTMVSNPNDLFNTYSFFDFDYPERPGADAVRLQYHTGFASRIELAYSPSRNTRESTAAMLWATNQRGYDLQFIAGYFRHRAALGLGWAGNIGGAGFKGEGTWFYDLEESTGIRRVNLVAALGLDYMFGNGLFVVLEQLYNGGYNRQNGQDVLLLTQPMRPDNIMFSEWASTLSLQQAFSSVLSGGLAVMALPDISAAFLMPSLNYSLATNFDMEFVGQIFFGGKGSIFEQAGSSWFLAVQYSF